MVCRVIGEARVAVTSQPKPDALMIDMRWDAGYGSKGCVEDAAMRDDKETSRPTAHDALDGASSATIELPFALADTGKRLVGITKIRGWIAFFGDIERQPGEWAVVQLHPVRIGLDLCLEHLSYDLSRPVSAHERTGDDRIEPYAWASHVWARA